MKINFTKMHGLGNDFVLVDCRETALTGLAGLSRALSHRRFGVGADQVLYLCSSGTADFKMRIFNADGGEVEMCGNGIRCLARYVWDRGLSEKAVLDIETEAGIIRTEREGDMVRVDMGEPVLEGSKIPVNIEGRVVDYSLVIEDRTFNMTCVSMGNPHAVIIIDNIADFPVTYYGPLIERHGLFPKRTNVEFIEVPNISEIKMRVWERGSGETMACGTGASAAAVACMLKGLTERVVTVYLTGGELRIEWSGNNHVYMTGPAVEVFKGEIEIKGLI